MAAAAVDTEEVLLLQLEEAEVWRRRRLAAVEADVAAGLAQQWREREVAGLEDVAVEDVELGEEEEEAVEPAEGVAEDVVVAGRRSRRVHRPRRCMTTRRLRMTS